MIPPLPPQEPPPHECDHSDVRSRRDRRSCDLRARRAAGAADAIPPRESREAPHHQERDGDLRQRQAALRAGRHRRPGRIDFIYRQHVGELLEFVTVVGRGHRRRRQVRHAGHRQRAHALARRAAARHRAADSVRAEPLPRGRGDHRAGGRRRLRQVEALAGRERRAHDHLAAHPGLSVRQQGADRIAGRDPRVDPRHQGEGRGRPQDHRHGSRSARSDHGRSAQAGAADGHAHRGGRDHGERLRRARRQFDRALLRRR